MHMTRRYRWVEISAWPVGSALQAGEVRAFCASPDCRRISTMAEGGIDPGVYLWVLARKMRCRACGHLGAQLEVWSRAGDLNH
jgi:hypothetical protein